MLQLGQTPARIGLVGLLASLGCQEALSDPPTSFAGDAASPSADAGAEDVIPFHIPTACNGDEALCDLPLNQVAHATTHNAMATQADGFFAPNQTHSLTKQLEDGIRALMLDLHLQGSEAWLCHGTCAVGKRPLVDGLSEIAAFLAANQREVVTLILESYLSVNAFEEALEAAGLDAMALAHEPGDPWPTLGELIDTGSRLVILSDQDGGERPWYLDSRRLLYGNHWHAESPEELTCELISEVKENGLFVLNHFLTNPVALPAHAEAVNHNPTLGDHATRCAEEVGAIPTFLAVDFYEIGDVLEVVRSLNTR